MTLASEIGIGVEIGMGAEIVFVTAFVLVTCSEETEGAFQRQEGKTWCWPLSQRRQELLGSWARRQMVWRRGGCWGRRSWRRAWAETEDGDGDETEDEGRKKVGVGRMKD